LAIGRSLIALAISAIGFSSSCHTRTAAGIASVSRTDGSSKKGVTITTSPLEKQKADLQHQPQASQRCPPRSNHPGDIIVQHEKLIDLSDSIDCWPPRF
jgi:hypothetical protein